jgi:excisionase family DNA binding protein
MALQVGDTDGRSSEQAEVITADAHASRRYAKRIASGRLLDLKAAETYSGISAWTLRDLIASGDLPAVRPPRLRRVWIDRDDLDKAIAAWKERDG